MKKLYIKIRRKLFLLVLPVLTVLLTITPALNVNGGVVALERPTPKVGTLFDFVVEVLKIVIKIGIPVVFIMFLITGYLFISAQGNDADLSKAKKALLGTVVGAAIVLCAVLIATIVKNTIGALGG